MQKIQDPSLFYESLRVVLHATYPFYFGRMEIAGRELIPDNEPVIFAANHQCGLIDPLSIILSQKKPIVYLARADIFKSKLNAWFLRKIKVAPIYRIRDGYENLSKNEEQLQLAVQVLLDKRSLGMMPEGNHGENHTLRPLVKGLFRVAYAAEAALENRAHVKIIPVAIDESDYQHAGTQLMIQFGKPIEVKDYLPTYQENTASGLNQLKERLETELSALMHDIRSNNYEQVYKLTCYGSGTFLKTTRQNGHSDFVSKFRTLEGKRFEARRALSKQLERLENEDATTFKQLVECCNALEQLPGTPNTRSEFLEHKPGSLYNASCWLAALIAAPGILLNLPAWGLVRWIMSGVEDKQMYHTFAFTMGLLVNLAVYPLVTVVVVTFFGLTFLKGLALLLLLATWGISAERIRQQLRMYWKMLPYRFGRKKAILNACRTDFEVFRQMLKNALTRY